MSLNTSRRFANEADLRAMLGRREVIMVSNAHQYTTKTRLSEPTNGTCAVQGDDGVMVPVLIREGQIVRVMT